MAEQPNISQILAALAAQQPGATPTQTQPPSQTLPTHDYPQPYFTAAPSTEAARFAIPLPKNSGNIDLSHIKPVNSGSVSLADAVAKARGIAAENGIQLRDGGTPGRDSNPRIARVVYRRSRSRSRSPPRGARDEFRDSYNPYRDERRNDLRRPIIPYDREQSFSPGIRGAPLGSRFSPGPGRGYGGPGDRSPMNRRVDEDPNVETINIDSGLVGLIIGRSGENLRRVEAETQTRVQFLTGPDASGPMRECKITGTRRAREAAKAEIYRIIEEHRKAAGAALATRASPSDIALPPNFKATGTHQPALRTGEDATQIMVPNRTVGLIIGRGGETIRDLQEKSQCHVNIVGEEKSVNGLRPVNLIGTPQASGVAKNLIMEIVESDTKNLANQCNQSAPGDKVAGLTPGLSGGDKVNDRIVVPSEAVGMIIGKGGETIKNMQATTGCKINVSPPNGPDFERDIGLVGSRDSIERAKQAIMEKVYAVQEKNRPGDGGAPRENPQYNEAYYQKQQQPFDGQGNAQALAGDVAADPYAPYGGYQNYVALWYASAQANQGQAQNQGPPGS